ncbi:MAG: HAMP domain-containing histidine kinase [Crocinitomicaceae bacterium]|nr:HAMP domain-containing histidine kinase [Crocinitomicaceae bacterium]
MIIFKPTLRTRIYLSMLAIILISFLVTGSIAIYDHFEQTEKYNLLRLERKEKSVSASLEYFVHQHGGSIPIDSVAHLFEDKVCELSDVHSIFIAMYDLRGNYLISTNSMMMDSLHVPYHISYSILKQLSTGNERAVLDKSYQSQNFSLAYWYFRDASEKPIAIINVAYDHTIKEGKDIMVFLAEIGQSYILLFLLAAFAAYLLSTYITRSLQTVSQRIQQVQFGKKNEPLQWESNDEIGALVKQYNLMLSELEKSAGLLAQQERESAWREMAQQVAHEIKNPLTPMKLRVQHLLRSWEDDAPHFEERLKSFSTTMIEQIDTLTRIANEFSSFAKMPRPNMEKFDILPLIQGVIDLHRNEEKGIIHLRPYHLSSSVINVDKDQIIRVFNNLLTNAFQALKTDTYGKIDIAVRNFKGYLIVRINDNGIGIPESEQVRIFVPNFTTKSTGTGLGLSMVHSIVQQNNGRVWFWSREGKGASFYLVFPLAVFEKNIK